MLILKINKNGLPPNSSFQHFPHQCPILPNPSTEATVQVTGFRNTLCINRGFLDQN